MNTELLTPLQGKQAPEQTRKRKSIYRNGIFYPLHKNRNHVPGPREKALNEFRRNRADKLEKELEDKFRELLNAIDEAAGEDNLYGHAVAAIGRDSDTAFSISCVLEGMYAAENMARAAFKDAIRLARLHMRQATSIATALNL